MVHKPFFELVPLLVGLCTLGLASIVVHEFGHWAAARLLGFRVHQFRAGGVVWSRSKGWHTKWTRKKFFTGGVLATPCKDHRFVRARWFLYTLAGPAANLLCACVLVLGLLLPARTDIHYQDVATLGASVSVLVAIVNLIPMRATVPHSDGARLVDCLSRKKFQAIDGGAKCAEILLDYVCAAPEDQPRMCLKARDLLLRRPDLADYPELAAAVRILRRIADASAGPDSDTETNGCTAESVEIC